MFLIPDLQLCLAHFCEIHGPTPLMVTEGLLVKCSSCDDHGVPDLMAAVASAVSSMASSPSSTSTPNAAATAATAAVADTLRKKNWGQSSSSSSSSSTPRITDPTATPRSHPNGSHPSRRAPRSNLSVANATATTNTASSSFRKTYDDSVTKRAAPCVNCAMTLPRRKTESNLASNGGDGGDSGIDARNPTLRTRVPCARVYDSVSGDGSPLRLHPTSSSASSSTSSDTEGDEQCSSRLYGRPAPQHRRTGTMASVTTSRSSTSSSASRLMASHTHYLDYTSTHEPVSADAYGNLRASCLRTLTLETLPRSPASSAAATTNIGSNSGVGMYGTSATSQPGTTSPLASAGFSTASYFTPSPHSATSLSAAAAAATNGGPLFFGDPAAGYTTAHVFRVADMHARGHKRVYALIALNTHRERMAMKAFGFISAAFNDLATWIQQLADAEADRVAALQAESSNTSNSGNGSPSTCTSNRAASAHAFGGGGMGSADRSPHVSPPPTQPSSLSSTQDNGGSSFLMAAGNGLSRRMGPGFAGFGGLGSSSAAVASLRARGLPEILGMPDFFIELHTRFVRLLLELGVALS